MTELPVVPLRQTLTNTARLKLLPPKRKIGPKGPTFPPTTMQNQTDPIAVSNASIMICTSSSVIIRGGDIMMLGGAGRTMAPAS